MTSSKQLSVKNFVGSIGLLLVALLASCGGGSSDNGSTPPQATGTVVITGKANQ